jgi:predicted lipoprotein
MNRVLVILGTLAAVGVLSWFFPLFHVESREALRAAKEQTAFHAADFVDKHWSAQLMPALADAPEAVTVLAALRENPKLAGTQFGRTVGLGRSTLYFVRGIGTIVSVDKRQIGVSLAGSAGEADVALETGLLFGNTVRDATGLLSGDDFPNSQQFNEVSSELNRVIETTVLPSLRERARVGDTIEFVGCAAVTSVPRDYTPLKLVPLEVTFQ